MGAFESSSRKTHHGGWNSLPRDKLSNYSGDDLICNFNHETHLTFVPRITRVMFFEALGDFPWLWLVTPTVME